MEPADSQSTIKNPVIADQSIKVMRFGIRHLLALILIAIMFMPIAVNAWAGQKWAAAICWAVGGILVLLLVHVVMFWIQVAISILIAKFINHDEG